MTGETFVDIIIIITTVAILALGIVLVFRKLRENESLKYEFVTIIAHKFRTPLTQIKWSVEGMLADEQDSYKKQTLNNIRDSNENLIKLTGTLVELTDKADNKKSAYNLEKIDLCELAHGCIETSKKIFREKNISIAFNCIDSSIFIESDRSRMEFVIMTLLENAHNYSPPGRRVTVTISGDKRRAAISVSDDGIGIDPHDMPGIFSKFYRTKQAQSMDTEGLGVALYLARSIVRRQHGKLEVFSEGLDRGSTFSVILKRVK